MALYISAPLGLLVCYWLTHFLKIHEGLICVKINNILDNRIAREMKDKLLDVYFHLLVKVRCVDRRWCWLPHMESTLWCWMKNSSVLFAVAECECNIIKFKMCVLCLNIKWPSFTGNVSVVCCLYISSYPTLQYVIAFQATSWQANHL
jgi:hypothetical protein